MYRQIRLSGNLLYYLKKEGYSHIQLRGIAPAFKEQHDLENNDDYILVPLKGNIGSFEESNLPIELIDSTDISDMLKVEFGIRFLVELPEAVADKFLGRV